MNNILRVALACLLATFAAVADAQPYAYLGSAQGHYVKVVDLANNKASPAIWAQCPDPTTQYFGYQFTGVAVDPSGTYVYVLDGFLNTVGTFKSADLLSPTTDPFGNPTVTATECHLVSPDADDNPQNRVNFDGATLSAIAVAPGGTKLYVSDQGKGYVSPVTLNPWAVGTRIKTGGPLDTLDHAADMVFSPDGGTLYVANYDNRSGAPGVSVIDTGSDTYKKNLAVCPVTSTDSCASDAIPSGIDISADGRYLYVSNIGLNTVSVIDTKLEQIAAYFGVGVGPWHLALAPDSKTLYVANAISGSVMVADTSNPLLPGYNTVQVPLAGTLWGIAVKPDSSAALVLDTASNLASLITPGGIQTSVDLHSAQDFQPFYAGTFGRFISGGASALQITTSAGLPFGVKGVAYDSNNVVFSASGGSLPYSWSSPTVPHGLVLDATTGKLTGTPATPGDYNFDVTVTDKNNATKTSTFTLVVKDVLTITNSSTLPDGTVGKLYSPVNFQVSGGTSPYSWASANVALPTGLALNAGATASLSGMPTMAGAFHFDLMVNDSAGSVSDTETFNLNVVQPLVVTTPPTLPAAVPGENYAALLAATGGTSPYSWTKISGYLPPNLALQPDGSIGGAVASRISLGLYQFTAQVTDHIGATATRPFILYVEPTAPQIDTASPLPLGAVGSPYSLTLMASGGVPPYAWSFSGLPAGLTSNTNSIAGVPQTAGTSQVAATVTDTEGGIASTTFSLPINPLLAITTSSPLQAATHGQVFEVQLHGSGGVPPYKWSPDSALPAGLTITDAGLVGGVVRLRGVYTFTIKLRDSAPVPSSTTQLFSLTVN